MPLQATSTCTGERTYLQVPVFLVLLQVHERHTALISSICRCSLGLSLSLYLPGEEHRAVAYPKGLFLGGLFFLGPLEGSKSKETRKEERKKRNGRKEGRKEGRTEGRKEGRKDGGKDGGRER